MLTIAHIMGPAATGKSTFIDYAKETSGRRVYTVEVGRMLRAKYPPSYFNGSNNPTHTAKEAWDLYTREIDRALRTPGVELVLVDGQPRAVQQAIDIASRDLPGATQRFLYFHTDRDTQQQRAGERDAQDPEALELAMRRIDNDRTSYCDVLVVLAAMGIKIEVVNTTMPLVSYANSLLRSLLTDWRWQWNPLHDRHEITRRL